MNDHQVDRVVDLIGDGPESIRGLRRLSIGLAVGGKLGGENNDAVFHALMAELGPSPRGKIDQWSVVTDDLPSSLARPERFVRLGSIARIEKGRTGIQAAIPGPYPMVVTAEHRLTCDHFDFDGAAAIVPLVSSAGHGKASLQRLHYQEGQFALGTILAAVFPKDPRMLSARFLFEYLSAFKDDLLVSRMIGTANVTLTIGKLSDVPVPLVAASVQARIDRIMGLCDRLEAVRAEREAVRDRLVAVSVANLNAPDPETFQAGARFALDALPALTTRPDQIKRLRQAVLNLAVRGKLVAQNAGDEVASELASRIAKEKARLLSLKNTKAKQAIPRDSNTDAFALPQNWAWCQLDEVAWKITDGDHLTPKREPHGHYLLSARNVLNGRIDLSDVDFVGDEEFARMRSRCDPNKFDILISCSGSVGRVAIVDHDETYVMVRSAALVKLVFASEIAEYISIALLSDCLQDQMGIRSKAAAQPNLFIGPIRQLMVPLPPLAEQHRIVARVNALMALCDRLETSFAATAATRRRLLDALLAEALDPMSLAEAA